MLVEIRSLPNQLGVHLLLVHQQEDQYLVELQPMSLELILRLCISINHQHLVPRFLLRLELQQLFLVVLQPLFFRALHRQPMSTQTAQTIGSFANSEFPQSSAGLSSSKGTAGILSHGTFSLPSFTHNTVLVPPVAPNASPFGALSAMPQLSIGQPGSTSSIQYGISSMPVSDKPAAPIRMLSLLTSRHLSQKRIRLPARKCVPQRDGTKMLYLF
ncbi:hypothetical protein U1Q18_002763 [Sarracenia purpurea var. burkii]